MIPANELRINNFVKAAWGITRVTFSDWINIGKVYPENKELWALDPVPLSPSVLQCCSFEQEDAIFRKGNFFCIPTDEYASIWKVYLGHHGQSISTAITDLHRLQNLYFFVNNEELPCDEESLKRLG